MTAPSVTNTFTANTLATAGSVNTNFSDLVTYLSNRNDGTATWDRLLVTSSSAVPLVVNNSTGTANIANFQDNGNSVLQIADGGDVFTIALTDYSASSTITGWTSFSVKKVLYKKIGKFVWVWFYIEGTSNATSVSFTLPYSADSTNVGITSAIQATDNGTVQTTPGRASLSENTSTVNCYSNMASAAWTNSGTKLVQGMLFYVSTS